VDIHPGRLCGGHGAGSAGLKFNPQPRAFKHRFGRVEPPYTQERRLTTPLRREDWPETGTERRTVLSKGSPERKHPVTVDASEVKAGLALLASEQHAAHNLGGRESTWELAQDLGTGVFIFCLALGLITIWWDGAWGIALLGLAAVAFVSLMVLPSSSLADVTQKLKSSVETADLGDVVTKKRYSGLRAAGLLVTAAAALFGFVMLMLGLIEDNEVPVWAFVVTSASSLAFWLIVAIDTIADYHYYSEVAKTIGQLKASLAHSDADATVEVSSRQRGILSRAEAHQATRDVLAATQQMDEVVQSSWGVSLTSHAKESLDHLAIQEPAAYGLVMSAIWGLQDDPRPPGAQPADETTEVMELAAGGHSVDYRYEDEARRIYVLSILDAPEQEGDGRHS